MVKSSALEKKQHVIDRELFALRVAQGVEPEEAYVEAGGSKKATKYELSRRSKQLLKSDEVKSLIEGNLRELAAIKTARLTKLAPMAINVLEEVLSQKVTDKNRRDMTNAAIKVLDSINKYAPRETTKNINITSKSMNIDVAVSELMKLINERPEIRSQIEGIVEEQPQELGDN